MGVAYISRNMQLKKLMEKVYNLEQQFNKLSEEIKEVKELYQLKKPIEFVKVLFKI
jgi:uncharacterized protein (UPF0335 family)